MQFPIQLGQNLRTKESLCLPLESFNTHYHFIGATGSGKTTAMETVLQCLLNDGVDDRSFFIVDPLGGFATRLLRYIADERYCSDSVRERLVYFEPANTDYTTTIQTLDYSSRQNQDYQVARAMELLMRGFDTQDLQSMPRLRRFLYQAVFDISQLGLPLSIAQYLLQPRTDENNSLLACLPERSRAVWNDVLKTQGNKALDYLDSTRSRVSILNDFVLLQRMFSSTTNLLDIPRFMKEGRIVIVNLSPGKKEVPFQVADTIGSVIINEVFNHALTQYYSSGQPTNTFLVLDEFHRFLGPDIYDFLPIVRNLGLKLMLANQSYSQLEKGEIDLRPMIAQARSRLMFANDLEDANILAEEIANFHWDPKEIKHQLEVRRQLLKDHETMILHGGSASRSETKTNTNQYKQGHGESASFAPLEYPHTRNTSKQQSIANVTGGSNATAYADSWREQLVPVYDEFTEVTGVQFTNKDEVVAHWRKKISESTEGRCYLKLVNDSEFYHVDVDYLPLEQNNKLDEAVNKLIEENYQNGPFISAAQADQDFEKIRQQLVSREFNLDPNTSSAKRLEDQHGKMFDH